MYGLEAIGHADGWSMAAVGAVIVISGLSVLSFLISQLHRLVDVFESGDKSSEIKLNNNEIIKKTIPKKLSNEIEEAFKVYISFTGHLGDVFSLIDLYRLSEEVGLPHPHISIRDFRNSGLLIPVGEGRFSWKLTAT